MKLSNDIQIIFDSQIERDLTAGCFRCCRVLGVGITRVALLSAGGAVTPHTMIHDVIVHEEYRKKGVKFLLNDIGTLKHVVSCGS